MKRKGAAILILAVLCSLTGCRETPEETMVVSKVEGLPDGAVIEKISDDEIKEMDLPEHWKEIIERGDGKITVEADLDLEVPSVSNTPIVEVKKTEYGKEQLEELVDYFSNGKKLYELPQKTKTELQAYYDMIEDGQGDYGSPDAVYIRPNMIKNLKELIEEAPDSEEKQEKKDICFSKPVQTAYGYALNGEAPDYFFENEFMFMGFVEDKLPAKIHSRTDCEAADSYALFEYKKGSRLTEEDSEECEQNLIRFAENPQCGEEWYQEYSDFSDTLKTQIEENEISTEEIKKQAEKVLSDLHIENMSLGKAEKSIWFPQDLEWNLMEADWAQGQPACTLTFGKGTGNIPAYNQGKVTVYEDLPEQTYSPPFRAEQMIMTFTEDGIVEFCWENMCEVEKVVAENTQLLSFEKIKEKLADHMLFAAVAVDELNGFEASASSNRYVVKDVQFAYTNVNAYQAPKNAWLVPVWVFQLDWYLTPQGSEEILREPETVVIQAVDGGYVGV